MPAARDLTLDEHGVKRFDRYEATCGTAADGRVFLAACAFLEPDAVDHIVRLLQEHAENARVSETARLICEGVR